jgi:Uma2 family endonuclease
MAQSSRQFLTVEEYLWEEQRAETRHDYYNGQVYNMAGGSPEHSRISVNLTAALLTRLRGRDCQVFNSDLKVAIAGNLRVKGKKRQQDDEFITYPDASVVCGQLEFYKDDRQTLLNPLVLFEVLHPSTRHYDQSLKLAQYRKIPGLMAYIMIDSEQVWLEQYFRSGQNTWQVDAPLEDRAASLQIACLDLAIPLANLYEGIVFEDE